MFISGNVTLAKDSGNFAAKNCKKNCPVWQRLYDEYLLLTEFEVRTVSYGPRYLSKIFIISLRLNFQI